MIYVASPYSHPIESIRERRYLQVREFVDRMIVQGFIAFSPIVYCHEMARRLSKDTDFRTWLIFNNAFLRRAEAVYVLELIDWGESKGVAHEMKLAHILSIPRVHYGPMNEEKKFPLLTREFAGHVPEFF